MRKFQVIFTIFIVSVAFFVFATKSIKAEVNKLTVGVILPLTGDGAKYGEEAKRGIDLALEEISGRKPLLIYEDDQGLAAVAVAAFKRITAGRGIPLVIGGMYSSTALAIAPIAERNKTILFSPSASTPALTGAGKYIFRNWPSDVFEGGAMAQFVYERLKQDKIAVLGQSLDYAIGITKEFKRKYQSLGGSIVAEEYYPPGTTDFRTVLLKYKSAGITAIYLPGMYAEISIILRQENELGFRPINISCVGFDNREVLKLAGDSAEGVIFARPAFDANSSIPLVRDFVKNFQSKYGIEPGVYAAHAYDAARIVFSALERGGSSVESIKTALHETRDFDGVTGKTTIDKNGDVVKPIQFMEVSNHDFVLYQK